MNRPQDSHAPPSDSTSRRTFLKRSSAAVVGGGLAASLAIPRAVHAAGEGGFKLALIGCGGRGKGAAVNAVQAEPTAKLTVMADLFPDRLDDARKQLSTNSKTKNNFAVTDDTCFVGFDAYEKAIASDVDVVLLTTPPHFRPAHLKAAVEAGKHVFCEKPVAVDGPGVRSVFETVEQARQKNLSIVSGLCWRYDRRVQETIGRILEGDIGDIVAIQENYLTGTLWQKPRQENWTDMEYQCRNWLYYTWLSGDHIVEQHVHSLDKGLWLNEDNPPLSCVGLGGRQVRTEPQFGNIYDHHAVCYDFPKTKVFAYTRQMRSCKNDVDDYVYGTDGTARVLKFTVEPKGKDPWKFSGEHLSMYVAEHVALFEGLKSGNHLNDGDYMTKSTLMAIMGRMATYTGQMVTWEQALNSQEDLTPPEYAWGPAPEVVVPMPGVTKLV
jgi:predicted dehydrogenase